MEYKNDFYVGKVGGVPNMYGPYVTTMVHRALISE